MEAIVEKLEQLQEEQETIDVEYSVRPLPSEHSEDPLSPGQLASGSLLLPSSPIPINPIPKLTKSHSSQVF
jgi:hypothetical protein